jgi:hypothetical protein
MSIELNENNRDDIRIPINLPEVLPEVQLGINREIGPELSQVTEQRRACNYIFWKINIFCCCLILLVFMTPLLLFVFFPDESGIIVIIYCALLWCTFYFCPCCLVIIYMQNLRYRQESLINELLGNEVLTEETENNLNNKLCSICIEDIVVGDEYTKLECSHSYHRNCLKQWIEVKSTCPLCRIAL